MERDEDGSVCVYCGEPFSEYDADWPRQRLNDLNEQHVHTACLMRSVVGSAGHQRGLCSCRGTHPNGTMEDPPGLTRRQAALVAYYEYVMTHPVIDALEQYAIYFDPLDFPGKYVVRLWHIRSSHRGGAQPTSVYWTADTIEEARKHIPATADTRMPRWEGDEPHIVETWF